MANVLLLGCNLATSPYPVFPLGLAHIAGALHGRGHNVRQADIQSSGLPLEDLLTTLVHGKDSFSPDLIGISIRNIDNVDFHEQEQWFIGQARDIVTTVKRHFKVPVIAGGAGFSLMAEDILQYIGADFGIVGEGEVAMATLVEELEAAGWNTAGLPCLHSAPALEGARIPAPIIDPVMGRFYTERTGIMGIQSKRGCPYGCAYCSYPLIEGKTQRYREPEGVAEQMERAYRDFGVDHFVFCDSVFNDRAGHFMEVAEAIRKRNMPVHWSGYFRPSHTTRDELRFLQEAGLGALELGTDAASDATLKGMNKPFCFDEVRAFTAHCAELALPAAHFIIMGGPAETRETVMEGLENIRSLPRSVVFVYQGVRILPGTLIEKIALQEGVITPDTPLLKPAYYHSSAVDQEEVARLLEADFAGDMTRIFPPSKADKMDKALRSMGHKGLLWDKLLGAPHRRRRSASARQQPATCAE